MIELTHIGDTLIAEMLNYSQKVRELFIDKLGGPLLGGGAVVAVPGIPLAHCSHYAFDESHRVDVGLLLQDSRQCLPIEAKLGENLLPKLEFEKRFLRVCGISNGGSRISGSMTSILERNLPVGVGNEIEATSNGVSYQLTSAWVLVVRAKVLASWEATEAPGLSANCKIITMEDIVAAFGTPNDFNMMVARLISSDYYGEWFGSDR